jgi:hypothetical protein
MAQGYTTRKLEVWSLHAHVDDGAVSDYVAMFRMLASLDATARTWEDDEKAVGVPYLELADGNVRFTAYEGPRGHPIVYDTADAKARTQTLQPTEIIATLTHGIIDLGSREAIIEYNHRGAKASDIAVVLGSAGRRQLGWRSLFVELSPKIDRSFNEAIDAFDRIRVAGLRVSRPNIDWTDWDDALADSAADSDAQSVQAEFTARRGASLSKLIGVIPFMKRRVDEAPASLKNAFVTGVRAGESAETTITVGDHKEHQRINVRLTPDKHVDEQDIQRRLDDYDGARRAEHDGDV